MNKNDGDVSVVERADPARVLHKLIATERQSDSAHLKWMLVARLCYDGVTY